MCVFWKSLLEILFPRNYFPCHLFSWQCFDDRKGPGYPGQAAWLLRLFRVPILAEPWSSVIWEMWRWFRYRESNHNQQHYWEDLVAWLMAYNYSRYNKKCCNYTTLIHLLNCLKSMWRCNNFLLICFCLESFNTYEGDT